MGLRSQIVQLEAKASKLEDTLEQEREDWRKKYALEKEMARQKVSAHDVTYMIFFKRLCS